MLARRQRRPSPNERPVIEALENRLFLSASQWSIFPSSYLDTGNEWDYAASAGGDQVFKVTGSKTVAGQACQIMENTTNGVIVDSYQSLSATDVLSYGSLVAGVTSTATDPMELFPRTIYSTDKNRAFGHGVFSCSAGGQNWTLTQDRTVTYLGQQNLSLAIDGQNATFSGCVKALIVHTQETSINPNPSGRIEFTIWFAPGIGTVKEITNTYNAAGALTGTVTATLTHSEVVLPTPEMSVWGNSVKIVSGDVSPTATDFSDFGDVSTKGNVTHTFTIQNTGEVPLLLTGKKPLTIAGMDPKDFTLTSKLPASIAAGGSATFTIKFAPTALGLRTAILSIANNEGDNGDGTNNPYTFAMEGAGVPPTPEINLLYGKINILNHDNTPSATDGTDFGTVSLTKSVTRKFTIKNTGTAKLNLTGAPRVVIGGDNPGDFVVTIQPSASVGLNASATFTIKFTPKALGTRIATISIANDDGNNGDLIENPFVFTIQGLAVA